MYERILVAVDSTPETGDVLSHTALLAKATGAAVRVLHVQTVEVVDGGGLGAVIEDESAEGAAQVVTEAVDTLKAGGVTNVEGWTEETVRGDVPNAVLDQARDFKADLVVMGSRRHGGVASLFLGSVSDSVAHRAVCPVLLVP
ncbi:universal stress protein [Streptomyces sp. SID3343]|uniref:universal stress protein n=1 Tax=Streptomyces sp. SID3343 TaxID=2690260 RepID=UPI00136E00C5|nr:universal stress protein [Streptomyces sp. SID3343]MYW03168.1 universal stress protein [Streptomyces sp. SID3343]